MSWQLLMVLQNTFASFYALESRTLAKQYKNAHFQILCIVFAILYTVFLVYALLNNQQVTFQTAIENLPMIIAVGAAFTIWTVLTFITFRYVDAAVGSLFSVLNLVALVVIATLTLGEGLSMTQIAGAGLLLSAILLTSSVHLSKKNRYKWTIALTLSIIASIFFGIAISGQKYLLDAMGGPSYAVFGIGAEFLPLLLLALLYKPEEFKRFKRSDFRNKVLLMGAIRGGAGLTFVLALIYANNASLIGMLSGVKIILTAILAAIILKELAFIKRKIIAALIAAIGVGIILV